MITRFIIFHESGIPIYSWPVDDEYISIISSFIAAIKQFASTYFAQDVRIVGLEKENVFLARYGPYNLAIFFVDRMAIHLIENMVKDLIEEVKRILDREPEDFQIAKDNYEKKVEEILERCGFMWLFRVSEYVYRNNSVMGITIIKYRNKKVTPLYMPFDPFLGYEKINEATFSWPRLSNIIRGAVGKFQRVTIIADNNRGIEYWVYNDYVAVIEHAYEEPIDIGNMEKIASSPGSRRILKSVIYTFALNTLDAPPRLIIIQNGPTVGYLDYEETSLREKVSSPIEASTMVTYRH